MIALVVGHTEYSPGAINTKAGLSEFYLNSEITNIIKTLCIRKDIQIVYRDTYKKLPEKINKLNPDYIISFHCNASILHNASGSEVLYYHKSEEGRKLAEKFQKVIVDSLGLRDRGIKSRTKYDRGGHLLKNTKAPCIILEPFFMDNMKDVTAFRENRTKYIGELTKLIDSL
jgi:N-acetylmuramoyl-L-alanine amidase